MKEIKINIKMIYFAIFFTGLVFGILVGMLIQNEIIIYHLENFIDGIHIENFNFEFNQTKLVEDILRFQTQNG